MEDYPYLNEALARVLRRQREGRGLSKRSFAEAAGLQRVYVIQLERGEKRPTLNAIFYLCDALQMPRQDFLAEIEAEMERIQNENSLDREKALFSTTDTQ